MERQIPSLEGIKDRIRSDTRLTYTGGIQRKSW